MKLKPIGREGKNVDMLEIEKKGQYIIFTASIDNTGNTFRITKSRLLKLI